MDEPSERRPTRGYPGGLTLAGQLLVATPALTGPPFEQSVVLVLEHGEDGAVGVVLNRPTPVPVADALPGWGHSPVLSAPEVIFDGGPVEPTSVLVVALALPSATLPDPGDGAAMREVGPRVLLVPFSAAPADAVEWAEGVRVFAGYAGWSPGQLEEELAGGFWYLVDAAPGDLVDRQHSRLWRKVLHRQDGELALLATWTPDPTLN